MKIRISLLLLLLAANPLFSQGKKNGMTSYTDSLGNVHSGKNKKGKHVGEWEVRKPNGTRIETFTYQEGVYNGTYRAYFANTSIYKTGTYVNGRKNGQWIVFNAQGDTTLIETYRNDTLHGPAVYWNYARGRSYGNLEHGKKTGWWIERSKGAPVRLDSIYYVNGLKHGPSKTYSDGQLKEEAHYKDGQQDGAFTIYHVNSRQPQFVGYYKDGKRDSVLYAYFPDGQVARVHWISNGTPVRYDSVWRLDKQDRILKSVTHLTDAGKIIYTEQRNNSGTIISRQFNGQDGEVDSILTYYTYGQLARREKVDTTITPTSKAAIPMVQHNYSKTGFLTSSGTKYGRWYVGKWVFNDSVTGKKVRELTFVDNHPVGVYKSYYPNGKKKVMGKIVNYNLQDSITVYSASGIVLKPGTPEYRNILDQQMREDPFVDYRDPLRAEEKTQDGDDEGAVEMVQADNADGDPNAEVFLFAETMPSFPGDSLQSYLTRNMRYPQIEKENGKEGTVYVQFIVEKDGRITNVKAIKEVPGAPGLTKEAVRLIANMPKWNPGLMNGRSVRVQVVEPVRFVLR